MNKEEKKHKFEDKKKTCGSIHIFGDCHSLEPERFSLAHLNAIREPIKGYSVESKVDKVFKLHFKRLTITTSIYLICQSFCKKYNKEGFQSLPANLECYWGNMIALNTFEFLLAKTHSFE